MWQEMENITVSKDLKETISGADVIVYAVGHDEYLQHQPEKIVELCGKKPLIIDCSNFVNDEKVAIYKKLQCPVKAVGKGIF